MDTEIGAASVAYLRVLDGTGEDHVTSSCAALAAIALAKAARGDAFPASNKPAPPSEPAPTGFRHAGYEDEFTSFDEFERPKRLRGGVAVSAGEPRLPHLTTINF